MDKDKVTPLHPLGDVGKKIASSIAVSNLGHTGEKGEAGVEGIDSSGFNNMYQKGLKKALMLTTMYSALAGGYETRPRLKGELVGKSDGGNYDKEIKMSKNKRKKLEKRRIEEKHRKWKEENK